MEHAAKINRIGMAKNYIIVSYEDIEDDWNLYRSKFSQFVFPSFPNGPTARIEEIQPHLFYLSIDY